MPSKIHHLRMEVACAGESLHHCEYSSTQINHQESSPLVCEAGDVTLTSPIPAATRAMVGELGLHVAKPGPKLVNSVEEFYEHTRLHRARVKALGLELYRTHPALFEGLSLNQVSMILQAHDKAKASPKSIGPDGRPFYRILYEDGFGKKLDRTVVDALNATDKKFMDEAMKRHGVTTPDLTAKMERLEKIADSVDRGMSHVSPEEFGRSMERGSLFLANSEDKKLAQELEAKYNQVTQKLKYQGLSPAAAKHLANNLRIEERFALELRSKDAAKVSARAMAHTLLENGRAAFARFLGVLATKGATKAFIVLDGVLLFFADMDRIGCSGKGYHDWMKDPNCSPAIGLTPKVVQFLNEDWDKQKQHLEFETHTCQVLDETYKQSITAPKVLKCGENRVEMQLKGGDKLSVMLDSNQKIKEIEMQDLGEHVRTIQHGRVDTVSVGKDGFVSGACFSRSTRGIASKKCLNGKDEALLPAKELLSSINYQIQKGIACCQKTDSSLSLICQ